MKTTLSQNEINMQCISKLLNNYDSLSFVEMLSNLVLFWSFPRIIHKSITNTTNNYVKPAKLCSLFH